MYTKIYKTFLLMFVGITLATNSSGKQVFMVVDSKLAYNSAGNLVNKCDYLSISDTVHIKEGGYLGLIHEFGHTLEFDGLGSYSLRDYISIETLKDTLALLDTHMFCHTSKRDGYTVTGAVKAGMTDYPLILTIGPQQVYTLADSIPIYWKYLACQNAKKGLPCQDDTALSPPQLYQVIVNNIFEEELQRVSTADTNMMLHWNKDWGDVIIVYFELNGKRIDEGESILIRLENSERNRIMNTLQQLELNSRSSKFAQAIFLHQEKLYFEALQILMTLANTHPDHADLNYWKSMCYRELLLLAYQKI